MTTILDYRPEIAAAVADGSLDVGLSADALTSLRQIHERMVALVAPLTRVKSLSEAEALATNNESEYLRLAEEWSRLVGASGFSQPKTQEVNAALYDIRLPNVDDQDQWLSTLQSVKAFLEWARKLDRRLDSNELISQDELLKFDRLFSSLHRPWGRYVMADMAISLVVAKPSDSSPNAIPLLARLADQCITEVEDLFLAEADYGDDDGEHVSLEDVRANLGL
ncbi:MAG: hypothetical protein OXC99_00515 [Chloroflexi bacterium]|nr:hypothetical protein [Chloroflexota bacterium]